MGNIQVLSFEVANLIAAGEVVDRPASAIKEMMENSIDAGAKHITVEIQNGGVTFMRVTDDGCGMSAEDLPRFDLTNGHAFGEVFELHIEAGKWRLATESGKAYGGKCLGRVTVAF